jgi:universal stress protein A
LRYPQLGQKLGVSEDRQHINVGAAREVVIHAAKDIHADLIVIGSHGRHGLHLLLGSTANGVLHEAECDVLAVRMKA